MTPFLTTPFSIAISENILTDLRARILGTRWPEQAPGAAWEQGTDLHYLRDLLKRWENGFNWRADDHSSRLKHGVQTPSYLRINVDLTFKKDCLNNRSHFSLQGLWSLRKSF